MRKGALREISPKLSRAKVATAAMHPDPLRRRRTWREDSTKATLAPCDRGGNLGGMSTAIQASAPDARQTEIYRRMSPKQRVAVALGMHDQARALMDAGLRAAHPDWTERERRREMARRTLHARD